MCVVLTTFTACGWEADSSRNLAKNIHINVDVPGDALKNSDNKGAGEKEAVALQQEGAEKEEGAFRFMYQDTVLVPGEVFDQFPLGECAEISEVPSCAFDRTDKVYHYGDFELTAYMEGNVERIYAIYFVDSNLPTAEGLRLGDTVDDMKTLYGENYKAQESAYTYARGDTLLTIITQNDIVISIEYRLR